MSSFNNLLRVMVLSNELTVELLNLSKQTVSPANKLSAGVIKEMSKEASNISTLARRELIKLLQVQMN